MAKKKAYPKLPRVHIACFDDGHIVPGMMSWLVNRLGWSMGNYLDPDPTTINYYAPYTMFARYGSSVGKSMAWFTHMETSNPAKMNIWQQAKQSIDLPLLTAPVYQSDLPRYAMITPGIDHDYFKPAKKKLPGRGIVGIVGVPQPRKGVELAQAIQGLDVVNEVVTVGGDWGYPIMKRISYSDMPEFYAGIDLLVCTSLEEGIPAPPFEALACGVPVVIPTAVGALDLLPDEFGIARYEKGNISHMLEQVHLHLDQTPNHDRSVLRDYVAPFTIDAWCESHAEAIRILNE